MIYKLERDVCSIQVDKPVLQAIKLLNEAKGGQAFLVVVNQNGLLVGTITDGDIRRALLNGENVQGTVERFMFKNPVFASETDSELKKTTSLQNINSPYKFLPIIDEDCKVLHVLSDIYRETLETHALIMAGGFGKRLGEKTKNKPKPLIEVGGKPLLEHVIENIRKTKVNRIYISVHYLAEQIISFVEEKKYTDFVSIIHEKEPLGTAGSMSLIAENNIADVLVTNCDIITELNYSSFLDFHSSRISDATIAVAEHKTSIPFGVVEYEEGGKFSGIIEKPEIKHYVAAGLYCFSPKYIKLAEKVGVIDMPEFLAQGAKMNMEMNVFPLHEEWTDVGRPSDLDQVTFKLNPSGDLN